MQVQTKIEKPYVCVCLWVCSNPLLLRDIIDFIFFLLLKNLVEWIKEI